MEQSIIYFITSRKEKAPVTLPNIIETSIQVRKIHFEDISTSIPIDKSNKVVLISIPSLKSGILEKVINSKEISRLPKIFLCPYRRIREVSQSFSTDQSTINIAIDKHKLDHVALGWLLELLLVQEKCKVVIDKLNKETNQTSEIVDEVFALARHELDDAKSECKAMQSILDFEVQARVAEEKSRKAMEDLSTFRDSEVGFLRNQLMAMEKLERFRDAELKDTMDILEATREVLNYAKQEEIDKDRIIDAQDKLREYTDDETKELIEENKKLRAELEKIRGK